MDRKRIKQIVEAIELAKRKEDILQSESKLKIIEEFNLTITKNKHEFEEAFCFLNENELIRNLEEINVTYTIEANDSDGCPVNARGPQFLFQYDTLRHGCVLLWVENGRGGIQTWEYSRGFDRGVTGEQIKKRYYPLSENGIRLFIETELFKLRQKD
jgi:hypothetical protein